ncbi:MAG TPA: hypothetical protein PK264_23595, partial [Hyphomicrobiaceae bacterium]|nr:hypothetical protein [Hyphomicrobiaceae bacterium]
MAHSSDDTALMRIALRMARRGLGTTAPNPSVGAVIADPETGEVIARGWTQPGGRPHAETEAIRQYRESLPEQVRTLFDRFQFCDLAIKVVGV